MSHTKMIFSIAVACFAFSGVDSRAAVYDFGDVLTVTHADAAAVESFAQLAAKGSSFGRWASASGLRPSSFSCLKGDASATPGALDAAPGRRGDRIMNFFDSSSFSSMRYIDMHEMIGGAPIAHAAQSPSRGTGFYAMLLAGLGLLFLSVHRRKSETFD